MSNIGATRNAAVPGGPRAFRSRIRHFGPIVALMPAALLAVVSFGLLRNNVQALRGIAGFVAAVMAAPGLLAAGLPLTDDTTRIALGVFGSAVLWIVVGVVAANRATRSPVATWREFWREYAWLAGGVWLGVVVAVVAIRLTIGRALL